MQYIVSHFQKIMQKVGLYLLFNFFIFGALGQEKPVNFSKNSLLYSGTEYVKQFNEARGNPFFPTTNNFGNISYNGYIYNNIDEAIETIKAIDAGIVRTSSDRWKLLLPELR